MKGKIMNMNNQTQTSKRSMMRPAFVLLILFLLIPGAIYPALMLGIGQVFFPKQANGSLIVNEKTGQVVGSELIGQAFTGPKYFWGRPSATAPDPYNAAASSGSNLGPTNPALKEAIQARIDALHAAGPGNTQPIPVDLVTASGSGLDPNISVAGALYQVGRVARERGISVEEARALIDEFTEGRQFGFLGEPRVNVLKLNLALDERYQLP
jgi:K+-transporting ATPase ATPase C chain